MRAPREASNRGKDRARAAETREGRAPARGGAGGAAAAHSPVREQATRKAPVTP